MIEFKAIIDYVYNDDSRKVEYHERCLSQLIKLDNKLYWKFISKVDFLKESEKLYQTIKIPFNVDVESFWQYRDMYGFITPFEEKHFEWIVD